MKLRTFFAVAGCVFLIVSVSQAADTVPPQLPTAFLPVDRFDFKEVVEGSEVVHEFIILNKGTAALNIIKVQTT